LFSSRRPSALSPPPKTLRISRVSLKPSESMRALTASAVRTSITMLVAVLSESVIIRRTASRKLMRRPSESSGKIPAPPTFFSFVSVNSSVHFARPSATRANASTMTAILMVLAVRTRSSPRSE
jgi:hypothetical protein